MELAAKHCWCLKPDILDLHRICIASIPVCSSQARLGALVAIQELDLSLWTHHFRCAELRPRSGSGLEFFLAPVQGGRFCVLLHTNPGHDYHDRGVEADT